jgi:hypothetical protein
LQVVTDMIEILQENFHVVTMRDHNKSYRLGSTSQALADVT